MNFLYAVWYGNQDRCEMWGITGIATIVTNNAAMIANNLGLLL